MCGLNSPDAHTFMVLEEISAQMFNLKLLKITSGAKFDRFNKRDSDLVRTRCSFYDLSTSNQAK